MDWPDKLPTNRKEEFTLEENYLMWGLQVIIPPELQLKMIKLSHDTHIGFIRMRALARFCVWWPEI